MLYLVCSLDDEHYLEPDFVAFRTEKEAIEECENKNLHYANGEINGNSHLERTGQSIRYDWSSGKDQFLVNEILKFDDINEYLLIRHHAYNMVDFTLMEVGSFDKCNQKMASCVDTIMKDDETSLVEKSTQQVIFDDGIEYIVYTIVWVNEILQKS